MNTAASPIAGPTNPTLISTLTEAARNLWLTIEKAREKHKEGTKLLLWLVFSISIGVAVIGLAFLNTKPEWAHQVAVPVAIILLTVAVAGGCVTAIFRECELRSIHTDLCLANIQGTGEVAAMWGYLEHLRTQINWNFLEEGPWSNVTSGSVLWAIDNQMVVYAKKARKAERSGRRVNMSGLPPAPRRNMTQLKYGIPDEWVRPFDQYFSIADQGGTAQSLPPRIGSVPAAA